MNRSGYLAVMALMVTAAALPAEEAVPTPVRALHDCRAITDATARLACFDKAAADFEGAVAAKQLTVLDRESVHRTKRALFGFSLPSIPLFGRDDERGEPEFTEIKTTIATVTSIGDGKFLLILPDGARWQTTDPTNGAPARGEKIRIKKAALGSYFLFIADDRAIRGRRVG